MKNQSNGNDFHQKNIEAFTSKSKRPFQPIQKTTMPKKHSKKNVSGFEENMLNFRAQYSLAPCTGHSDRGNFLQYLLLTYFNK